MLFPAGAGLIPFPVSIGGARLPAESQRRIVFFLPPLFLVPYNFGTIFNIDRGGLLFSLP